MSWVGVIGRGSLIPIVQGKNTLERFLLRGVPGKGPGQEFRTKTELMHRGGQA